MTLSIVSKIMSNPSYLIGEEINIQINIINNFNAPCKMFAPVFGTFNQLGRSVFDIR